MPRRPRSRARHPVRRSAFSVRDLISESLAGITQRPGRSLLTMLGTVLGIGAFVAILGLTATTSGQIDKQFSVLTATAITVNDVGPAGAAQVSGGAVGPVSFPADAGRRIEALNGAVHAGVYWQVPDSPKITASLNPGTAASGAGTGLTVYAADPGVLAAMHTTLSAGRLYSTFHQQRAEHVCVLGSAAAARLGVIRLDAQPAVFVNGIPYTVVGIVSDVQRLPEMLLGVLVPTSTALADFGAPSAPRAAMLIETRIGAAQLIASQAPLAIRPDVPQLFTAIPPPDPRSLRNHVGNDLNSLFLLLAAISLIIGAVGIANTTLVAVLERTPEIGLRRSLGARPRHIAWQFLAESTTLGTLGGLIGTSLGVAVTLGMAIAHQWTAILQPWAVLPAPAIGTLVGLLAGLYPSLRAAWIEPVEALRR